MNFETVDDTKIQEVRNKVELDAEKLEGIIAEITKPYTEDLDNYVDFIRSILADTKNPPSAVELDDFCINLSTYLYYAGAMQERLGLKDDISKAIYKEMYNNARQSQEKGTVQDKTALAELVAQHEELVSMIYHRSYGTVKAKVSAGQELLSSIKKIISRRMSEAELTRIGMGNI